MSVKLPHWHRMRRRYTHIVNLGTDIASLGSRGNLNKNLNLYEEYF